MNLAKAALFDAEAHASWAAAPYATEDQPKIARLLNAAEIDPGARLLEPGCGTGRLTVMLANAAGLHGRVVALDISERMIEACRARLDGHPHVILHHAAIEDFPFEPETFDAIVCHQVVPHFDDVGAVFAHLAPALRQGGRLLVVHFIGAARVNAVHQAATNPILHHDLLPPTGEMAELLRVAGLTVDWEVEDNLGYLVRARRLGSESARRWSPRGLSSEEPAMRKATEPTGF